MIPEIVSAAWVEFAGLMVKPVRSTRTSGSAASIPMAASV
jgi:hypothetical protein